MQITLDIPDQYLIDQSPDEFGNRIKLYAALMMFQEGSLSAGAASEFAGVDRFTFIAECQQHNIPLVDFAPEELDAELEYLRKIA
jgi:predicted HTH domain antitoxin